jgi:hypothetical protein
VEKLNWPLLIVLAIIVNVIANLAQGVLGIQGGYFGCIYSMGFASIPFSMPTLALVLPMLAYLTKFIGKTRLSVTTLATLYVVGLVSSFSIGNFNDQYYSWPVGSSSRVWRAIPAVRDVMKTLWWVPPEAAVATTWGKGGPVDWAAWFPAMLYVCLFHWLIFLMTSPMMIILRRRWIEVERVPYPFAMAIWEGIRNIHGFPEVKHRRMPFLIGLLVSFLVYLQIMFTNLLPWWPDVIGWRLFGPSPNGCVDTICAAPLKPLGSALIGFARVNAQPINYAIAYLVPLDILFTMWFFWLFIIIPLSQVALYFGYYTGWESLSGGCREEGWVGASVSPTWGAPLYWNWMCVTGGMLAMVIMMLWHARDYLREVFGAALGRVTLKDVEAKEPMSYRSAFIMLVVGCIAWIAFLASLQIGPVLGAIVFIMGGIIYPLAEAYGRGLTGAAVAQERNLWPSWVYHLAQPGGQFPGYTAGHCMGMIILHRGVNTAGAGLNTWSTVTMDSFRLANLSGVSPRTVYKLVALTLLMAYPITVIFRVWWPHYLGARFPNCLSGWECAHLGEGPWGRYPPIAELVRPITLGFIIVVLLSLLRARFIWWPLHPMGFLLSGCARETWTGAWTNFLGAWIVKFLTLRIGGSKAYEEYGVPAAAGVLAGFVLAAIIGVIVGLIRWFIPF